MPRIIAKRAAIVHINMAEYRTRSLYAREGKSPIRHILMEIDTIRPEGGLGGRP